MATNGLGPPRISVITPSLNQGCFIERTIRSVLDQGYPNLEYVIVDGGSSDETVEIIRRYQDRLAWWVSEPDGGQTHAINRGIAGTTGEIVAYLNSDDYYFPGALEAAAAALGNVAHGWVAGAAKDLDEEDRPAGTDGTDAEGIIRPTLPDSWEYPPRGRQWWLLSPWHVPQPAVFWRRELFERHGLFREDMHYAFDAEFMVRLALAGELPALLPEEVLAVRLQHDAAKSAEWERWIPEIRQLTEIHSPALTAGERRWIPLLRSTGTPPYSGYASGTLARVPGRAIYRFFQLTRVVRRAYSWTVTRAGDVYGLLPERIRPPIRTRDRR